MRKVFSGILAMVIVLSVCVTTSFAAGSRCGRYFVNVDGDRICDSSGSACIYADVDWDGVCDVCGVNLGSCLTGEWTAFVDTDGDGVCDNYVTGQCRGNGRGNGTQGRHGGNFLDADGDGVCDNCVSGQGQGGYGCGSQRGRGNSFRGGCDE